MVFFLQAAIIPNCRKAEIRETVGRPGARRQRADFMRELGFPYSFGEEEV